MKITVKERELLIKANLEELYFKVVKAADNVDTTLMTIQEIHKLAKRLLDLALHEPGVGEIYLS